MLLPAFYMKLFSVFKGVSWEIVFSCEMCLALGICTHGGGR